MVIVRSQDFGGRVMYVTYSPDGSELVANGVGMRAVVYDAETGESIKELDIYGISYLPDSNRVVVSEYSRVSIQRWLTIDQLLAWTLEHRYVPPFTCAERELYKIEPTCDDSGFYLRPTLVPTRTPLPVSYWTPIATPTASPMPSATPISSD